VVIDTSLGDRCAGPFMALILEDVPGLGRTDREIERPEGAWFSMRLGRPSL